MLLGAKYGALSQFVYVALGLVGLPIFTAGGGFGYLLYPTCGFLIGLIPAAWVIGKLTGGSRSIKRIVPACLANLAVLYLVGLPYMAVVLNVYMGKGLSTWSILMAGMIPYLPGGMVKIIVVASSPPSCCPTWERRLSRPPPEPRRNRMQKAPGIRN